MAISKQVSTSRRDTFSSYHSVDSSIVARVLHYSTNVSCSWWSCSAGNQFYYDSYTQSYVTPSWNLNLLETSCSYLYDPQGSGNNSSITYNSGSASGTKFITDTDGLQNGVRWYNGSMGCNLRGYVNLNRAANIRSNNVSRLRYQPGWYTAYGGYIPGKSLPAPVVLDLTASLGYSY